MRYPGHWTLVQEAALGLLERNLERKEIRSHVRIRDVCRID